MTIWRTDIACWITKATNTNSEYVIVIGFPLRQWFNERPSLLHYTYFACPDFTEKLVPYKTQKCTLGEKKYSF